MSFRSRTHTTQQPVVRRRSFSGSRVPSTPTSYSNNRPLSSLYPSTYTPTYVNQYSSRDNLLSPSTRSNYNLSRRESFGGSSGSTYKSPYADRYISPYTTYDNGVTTAGLSLKSSPYSSNGYSSKSYAKSSLTSKASDYPLRHSSSLYGSNTSLNSYTSTASIPKASTVSRSQSFKDHERKSRSCRRTPSLQSTRSLSVSSEKSEGYEVRIKFHVIFFCFNFLFKGLFYPFHTLVHHVFFFSSSCFLTKYYPISKGDFITVAFRFICRVAVKKHQPDRD